MAWRDEVIAGLPSPDDREPRSLRGDIVDELADHLACAMQRELRRTDDETLARERVLERFGDIRQLARRLWWEAMRDGIMKDRIFSVVLVILTLAFVAAFVMPWVAKQREIDAAILARLEQIATQPPQAASQPAVPENWSKLSVRVVRGEGDGPPVPGVRVTLRGQPFSGDVFVMPDEEDRRSRRDEVRRNERALSEKTAQDGSVLFGPILPGVYSLIVDAEDLQLRFEESVTLYPGQQPERVIHYPDFPSPARLKFTVAPTEQLAALDASFRCTLSPAPLRLPSGTWKASARTVVIDARGQILGESPSTSVRSLQIVAAGGYSFETYYLRAPIEQTPELEVSPVTWRLSGVTAGIAVLSESPDFVSWQHSASSFTPEEQVVVEPAPGAITHVHVAIPEQVVARLREMRLRRMGIVDVPASLIADPEWTSLRADADKAVQHAIQLARSAGKTAAAIEAHERATQAFAGVNEREHVLLGPLLPPGPGRRVQLRQQPSDPNVPEAKKLAEEVAAAREEVSRLYLQFGPGHAEVAEAVAKMKELERRLLERQRQQLGQGTTAPAAGMPLPGAPAMGPARAVTRPARE